MLRILQKLKDCKISFKNNRLNDNENLWRLIVENKLQAGDVINKGNHTYQFTTSKTIATYELETDMDIHFRGFVDPANEADFPALAEILNACGEKPVYLAGCYFINNELVILTRNLLRSVRHDNITYLKVTENVHCGEGKYGKIIKIAGTIKPEFALFGNMHFVIEDSAKAEVIKDQKYAKADSYTMLKNKNELLGLKKAGYFDVYDIRFMGPPPEFEPKNNAFRNYQYREDHINFLFTMKFFNGQTVLKWYEHINGFQFFGDCYYPPAVRLTIAIEFMRELAYLHAKGITHCDLNLGNIIILFDRETSRVKVRILDYGFSEHQESLTRESILGCKTAVGTKLFHAPETMKDGMMDQSTDIFSAGLILGSYILGTPETLDAIKSVADLAKNRQHNFTGFNLLAEFPKKTAAELMRSLSNMTRRNSKMRPSAADIVCQLEEIRHSFIAMSPSTSTNYRFAFNIRNKLEKDRVISSLRPKTIKMAELRNELNAYINQTVDDPVALKIFATVAGLSKLYGCTSKAKMLKEINDVFTRYRDGHRLCKAKLKEFNKLFGKANEIKNPLSDEQVNNLKRAIASINSFLQQMESAASDFESLIEQGDHFYRKSEKLEKMMQEYFLKPADNAQSTSYKLSIP